MKVAIVHEMLIKLGGAERVLKVLADMFPSAPIYTLIYDEKKCGEMFPKDRVQTSFLQNKYNWKFPLSVLRTKMPQAIESFDFSEFDLVISSSSAFAHGILTNTETKHICYCHSPARYLWDWHFEVIKEQGKNSYLKKFLIPWFAHKLRVWDRAAADRPDKIIANSKTVQGRVKKFWGQESEVIYPPVDTERFEVCKNNEGYFLIVSALSPFKRIDVAVEAFSKIPKHKLVIIGDGSEMNYLKNIAGDNIEFLGRKNDRVVKEYMENCRAFVFPGIEDFGITPVEAMACGKPVIALNEGGVTESVIKNETGIFFNHMTSSSLLDGMVEFFETEKYFDPNHIRVRAEEFSQEKFVEKIKAAIKEIKKEELIIKNCT